ncbi:MAG: hypothetical protein R3D67_00905 [Hyphomicrobiaceae bacterium]
MPASSARPLGAGSNAAMVSTKRADRSIRAFGSSLWGGVKPTEVMCVPGFTHASSIGCNRRRGEANDVGRAGCCFEIGDGTTIGNGGGDGLCGLGLAGVNGDFVEGAGEVQLAHMFAGLHARADDEGAAGILAGELADGEDGGGRGADAGEAGAVEDGQGDAGVGFEQGDERLMAVEADVVVVLVDIDGFERDALAGCPGQHGERKAFAGNFDLGAGRSLHAQAQGP